MPVLPQPTPMRASRRGPLHGLPDSNTRSLEGARLQPADLVGESPGVVTFNEQDWSLSNERRQMARAGWNLVRESGRIFLEAAPANADPAVIGPRLAAIPAVVEVHDLHVWQITSGQPSLS